MPFVTRLPHLSGSDPYPGALLALDFAGTRRGPQYYSGLGVTTTDVSKIPGWTYTGGASTGSYAAKRDGSLQLFPQNVPRITDAGYLAEEARTNSIRNSSMVGAVVGTPGTAPTNWTVTTNGNSLSVQLVATGTDNVTGAPYVEYRFYGTTSNANGAQIKFEAPNGIVATNGQAWTLSVYSALVAGSVSGFSQSLVIQFDMNNSGSAYLGNSSSVAIPASSTMTRTAVTFTTNQATTAYVAPSITISPGSGRTVDFTIRVSLPQMELGSFATSPIPTTSVAVTRAADVGYISGLSVPSAYTMLASGVVPAADAVSNKILATLGVGTDTNNRASVIRFTTAVMSPLIYNAGSGAGPSGFAVTPAARVSAALAFASGSASFTADGNTATTAAATAPSGAIDRLSIGMRNDNGVPYNGPIQRIVIYPRPMGAAELQAITTAGAY